MEGATCVTLPAYSAPVQTARTAPAAPLHGEKHVPHHMSPTGHVLIIYYFRSENLGIIFISTIILTTLNFSNHFIVTLT